MSAMPARYVVVKPEPLRMIPGLYRLGHDFGNGAVDGEIFQRDARAAAYRHEKLRVLDAHPDRLQALDDDAARGLQARAFEWMQRTFELEHGWCPVSGPDPDFRALSLELQEDFALLQRDAAGVDRLVLLSVCFPSGWRPETLLGASFEAIHAPVPLFEEVQSSARQLVGAIIERGPYVRFVWTVTADARLDHHPDHSPRDPWGPASEGVLRVERQVTVPFPQDSGFLFLIRTYLYQFSDLSADERSTLQIALDQLPEPIAEYKGLTGHRAEITRCLSQR